MSIIAVTGSRDWSDEKTLAGALNTYLQHGDLMRVGDCPSGADYLARLWAARNHVGFVRYDADWDRYGLPAGPIRNREMLDDGAELLIAFRAPGRSRGTDDCIKAARERGIPVLRIEAIP